MIGLKSLTINILKNMTDNNINSTLFELQKNLEDLSSAKQQMEEFRLTSKSVVDGIGQAQERIEVHLIDLENDYKLRINKIEDSLKEFIESIIEENKSILQEVAQSTETEINKGVEQFNSLASKVTTSNEEKGLAILKLIEAIEADYQLKLKQLQETISNFISNQKEENRNTILDVTTTSKESINQGVDKLGIISDKIESSNNDNIVSISNLLENYKSLVDASRTLIDTINAVDFPSKLEAISLKTQLLIESNINTKQAIELKLNESQNSIIEKTLSTKEQIVQNIDTKIQSIALQINKSNDVVNKSINDKFLEQESQFKKGIENTNNILKENNTQINKQLSKQEKEIKLLKMIAIISTVISLLTIVFVMFLMNR